MKKKKAEEQIWHRHRRHCLECDFCLDHNDHCFVRIDKLRKKMKQSTISKKKKKLIFISIDGRFVPQDHRYSSSLVSVGYADINGRRIYRRGDGVMGIFIDSNEIGL